MKYSAYPTPSTPAGFAMLEVLIAILVVSFGLLGLASLQGTGLRNSHSAYMRSIATQQAYDIADRMRANNVGTNNGNYNMSSVTAPSDPACITAGCAPASMAQYDAFQWKTNLALFLPRGQGIVCLDSTPNDGTPAAVACDGTGSTYAVKIWWNDEKDPAITPNLKLFVTSLQP